MLPSFRRSSCGSGNDKWDASSNLLASVGTGRLGRWGLVEQLHRECTVSDGGSGSKRGRQHRGFRDFFASGAGAFGCAGVHIQAIRALRRACHRDRDQFAILPRDGAVFASDNLVELYEGREFRWREFVEFLPGVSGRQNRDSALLLLSVER